MVVRRNFEQALCGTTSSFAELVIKERASVVDKANAYTALDLEIGVVPSAVDISRSHAKMKALKGVGENCIGGELHKLLPTDTARLLHPLHTKATMTLRRPLQWNGGQLMVLWKSKGSRADISNYRDVTLTDQDAKVSGRLLRSQLIQGATAMSSSTQMGSGMNLGRRTWVTCLSQRRWLWRCVRIFPWRRCTSML
jgi:hypothetical protein